MMSESLRIYNNDNGDDNACWYSVRPKTYNNIAGDYLEGHQCGLEDEEVVA